MTEFLLTDLGAVVQWLIIIPLVRYVFYILTRQNNNGKEKEGKIN